MISEIDQQRVLNRYPEVKMTIETAIRYYNQGLQPGSFTQALIDDDLETALERADINNRRYFYENVMAVRLLRLHNKDV